MDEVPWTLGCGCSYYQKELFAELLCPCEAWLADFSPGLAEGDDEFDVISEDIGIAPVDRWETDSENDFFDTHDDHVAAEEDVIIHDFLSGFPRGGAGGAAASTRKKTN